MSTTTIRVSRETRDRFARLAGSTGRPMTELAEEAVDALERRLFFDQLSARYEQLHEDAAAWAAVEAERDVEDSTLGDAST